MKAIRETIIAGDVLLRSIRVPVGNHQGIRKPKSKVTSEQVRKNNRRIAVRRLTALLNANFDSTCSHVTLTYEGEAPSKEEAARDRKNFVRKLRRVLAKTGTELKYIIVTEYENKRIHHHIVVNTQDLEAINKCWDKGFSRATALGDVRKEDKDYSKLAEYLVKETDKTFRLPDSVHKQRYSASRNLIQPVIKREEVSMRLFTEDPKPVKGYHVVKDSVKRFEHPITGLEHIEWTEIADSEKTKIRRKVWPKGSAVPWRENFRPDELNIQEEWSEWT